MKRERDRKEPFDRLAEFLVEDILSMSDDQLLAEVTDDCGTPDALAAEFDSIVSPVVSEHNTSAVKQRPSIAANNNPRQEDREADPLADFMVEDILSVSDDQLLAEAVEDYGSPTAMATAFDSIVSAIDVYKRQRSRLRNLALTQPLTARQVMWHHSSRQPSSIRTPRAPGGMTPIMSQSADAPSRTFK